MFKCVITLISINSDNLMSDIYGANLYNGYLQNSRSTRAQMQAKSGEGGINPVAGPVDDVPVMTQAELGSASGVEDLPEGCSSILVCTGVYSREQQEAPSDPTHTVSEKHIFHGHRDFCFNPGLMQPSFVVHDVKEAVELVFQQEGWPLE